MTDEKLTPAQRVALEWLPGAIPCIDSMEAACAVVTLADLEQRGLVAHHGFHWRITQTGEAMRQSLRAANP